MRGPGGDGDVVSRSARSLPVGEYRTRASLEASLHEARQRWADAELEAASARVELGEVRRQAAGLGAELEQLRASSDERIAVERATSRDREAAMATTACDAMASSAEVTEAELARAVAAFSTEVGVLRGQVAAMARERERTLAEHAEELADDAAKVRKEAAADIARAFDQCEAVRREAQDGLRAVNEQLAAATATVVAGEVERDRLADELAATHDRLREQSEARSAAEDSIREVADRLESVLPVLATRTAERDRLADELMAASGELTATQRRLREETAARAAAEELATVLQAEVDELQFGVMDRAADKARARGLFRRPKEVAPIPRKSAVPPRHREEPPPPASDAELENALERRLFGS